jgi:membrane protease subunit (stomatin/prohibitin family)
MIFGGVVMMGLVMGCATAAPSQQASSSTAQGQQADKTAVADAKDTKDGKGSKKDALICESVAVTGSHIPRKICRTARQVEEEREAAQKAMRDAERINRDFNQ